MVKSVFDVLGETDKKLVLETEPKKLKGLDEDELVALHTRVRRARNRHTKLYRREAAGRVEADRARGMASKKSQRTSARAEVMEEALARVSRVLADRADQTAEQLRAERLEQAKGKTVKSKASKSKDTKATSAKSKVAKSKDAKSKSFTPSSKKARAGAKASGKRAQASRDSRS